MRHDKYILVGKDAVPFETGDTDTEEGKGRLIEWAETAFKQNRIVRQERLKGFFVSTVFLGLDHNWGEGRPLLFETMVFDRFGESTHMDRCSTWDEAETQHLEAINLVKAGKIKHDYRRGIREAWRHWKWRMKDVVIQSTRLLFNRST